MHRRDFTTLHHDARRYRSRLMGYLIRRSIRAVTRMASRPRPQPMLPALAR